MAKKYWSHSSRERGLWRWWLHRRDRGGTVLRVEIAMPSHSWFSVGFDIHGWGDDAIHVTVCLLRFGLYLGFNGAFSRWLTRNQQTGREYGVSIHNGKIWIKLGGNPMEWSNRDPWWWNITIDPARILFGRMKHSERTVSKTETVIPMPEGSYPCVVELRDERWQRARLPFASQKLRRAHIEVESGGVPVPGKGESAWDCGDDAIYSLCCPAKTVEEGIAAYVESAMRTRRRYGGSVNWRQHSTA